MPEEIGWLAEAINNVRAEGYATEPPRVAIDTQSALVVPPGYQTVALANYFREDLQQNPRRAVQKPVFDDIDSFAAYWNEFKEPHSRIYADVDKPTVVGILNGHAAKGLPGWGDHTATLKIELSREFKIWAEQSGRSKSQTDFAQFIEDNLPDIVLPDPAKMLEMVRTLEGTANSSFTGHVRQQTGGHKLSFQTEVSARAGERGDLTIPETFTVAIPIFRSGGKVKVTARLRFRISNGGCQMWYDLARLQDAKDEAFEELVSSIAEACEQVVLRGRP